MRHAEATKRHAHLGLVRLEYRATSARTMYPKLPMSRKCFTELG